MESTSPENIQTTEETNPPADTQLSGTEVTAETAINPPNDVAEISNQHTEEVVKVNNDQNEIKNTEIQSVGSTGSKNSINITPKLSSRSSGQQPAVKQDVRAYLEEKVFPVLTNGLEELLKAVDERNKKLNEEEEEEEPIPEIHPLFFLARYLMKNAPHSSTERSRASSQHSETRNDEKEDNTSKELPKEQNEELVSQQNDDENKPTEM